MLALLFAWSVAQTGPTPSEFQWVTEAGATGVLLMGIVGFVREWFVTGSVYRRRVDEVRAWEARIATQEERHEAEIRDLTLRLLSAQERTIPVLTEAQRTTAQFLEEWRRGSIGRQQ